MIIIRRLNDYHDKMRPYWIYLDGGKVNKIKNGKEIRLDVTEGEHTIALKVDWCSSKPVKVYVQKYENIILECYPSLRGSKRIIPFKSLFKDRANYIQLNCLNKTVE